MISVIHDQSELQQFAGQKVRVLMMGGPSAVSRPWIGKVVEITKCETCDKFKLYNRRANIHIEFDSLVPVFPVIISFKKKSSMTVLPIHYDRQTGRLIAVVDSRRGVSVSYDETEHTVSILTGDTPISTMQVRENYPARAFVGYCMAVKNSLLS